MVIRRADKAHRIRIQTENLANQISQIFVGFQ